MSNSLEAVEFLIKMARPLDEVTYDSLTALHYAVTESCIRILIRSDVDPRKARNDGFTPLYILVNMIKDRSNKSYGRDTYQLFATGLALLQKILENLGSASDLSLGSELIYLTSSSSFPRIHKVILALLKYRLNFNITFTDDKTTLMTAAHRGDATILNILLLYGADPSISTPNLTVLYYTCLSNYKYILIALRKTEID